MAKKWWSLHVKENSFFPSFEEKGTKVASIEIFDAVLKILSLFFAWNQPE